MGEINLWIEDWSQACDLCHNISKSAPLKEDLLYYWLAVEFDYSGSYLAVGGSDIRCSQIQHKFCIFFLHIFQNHSLNWFSNTPRLLASWPFLVYAVCSVASPSFISVCSNSNLCGISCRVYQVASVKQEWNTIKIFPDLSGTGDNSSCLHAYFEQLNAYFCHTPLL